MSSLNLFPVRVPIGKAIDSAGKSCDVLMTMEFARALSNLLLRVGGNDGLPVGDIEELTLEAITLQAFDSNHESAQPATSHPSEQIDSTAMIGALMAEVAQLRAEVAMLSQGADFSRQIDDLRIMVEMSDPKKDVIKGTATGSRAANAALASLLTALARSGLVIDNTTV